MKARIALLAAPLALLAACGEDETPTYTLSTGTYAVSGATVANATPGDQCGLIGVYQEPGKQIAVAVNGTTATFDLVPVSEAITRCSATINGNALEAPVEANYTINFNNCLVRIRRTVVGELTGNDAAALQLHAQIAVENNGTDCDARWVAGCQSDIHFLATKVQ